MNRHGYSQEAVNKAIAASNRSGRRISGKEARMIHALLKGRQPQRKPEEATMKKFARHKSVDEIKAAATAQPGITVDASKHDNDGHDHILVEGFFGPANDGVPVRLLYNTFNGRFFGEAAGIGQFNSDTAAHDGKPWFDAILNFFYVEAPAGVEAPKK